MNKELLGILISYKVRVNLMVSYGGVSEGFQLVWAGVDRMPRSSGDI